MEIDILLIDLKIMLPDTGMVIDLVAVWEQVYNTDHTSVYLCHNNSYNFLLYIF